MGQEKNVVCVVLIGREEGSVERGGCNLHLGVSKIKSRLIMRKWSMMSGEYFDRSSPTSSVFWQSPAKSAHHCDKVV